MFSDSHWSMDFSTYTHAKQKRGAVCTDMRISDEEEEEEEEEASVWRSHLGQEVRRLSSYAFQNERGFSVQIGVLWVKREEGDKKKGEQRNRQNVERSVPDDSWRLINCRYFDLFVYKRSVAERGFHRWSAQNLWMSLAAAVGKESNGCEKYCRYVQSKHDCNT